MKIYLAPMEGITDYIFRDVLDQYYGCVDKFYTPFLSVHDSKSFTGKELAEIAKENNPNKNLVPQLLVSRFDYFDWAAKDLMDRGYKEINLNFGCPSGTVVSKKKGSGFLAYPEEMDAFLLEVFSHYSPDEIEISIKTRLGKNDPEEFYRILDIYNKYPISELTIHPRIQKDFYREPVRLEYYQYAKEHAKMPLCYNGEIKTVTDALDFSQEEAIMIGRGLVANPALAAQIQNQTVKDLTKFREFHNEILRRYQQKLSGDKHLLARMKELWAHMLPTFTNYENYQKELRKSQSLQEYKAVISKLFTNETQL